MEIIENTDGLFYWETVDGDSVTSSMPFTRDQTKTRTVGDSEETYNVYDDLISQGYKLVPLPQAEKDAHNAALARDAIIAEIAALDMPSYVIERALAGDNEAIKKIKDNEEKKALIRARL